MPNANEIADIAFEVSGLRSYITYFGILETHLLICYQNFVLPQKTWSPS